MRMKRRRRPRKRSGISQLWPRRCCSLLPAAASGGAKKKPTLDTYATVGVSVFTTVGLPFRAPGRVSSPGEGQSEDQADGDGCRLSRRIRVSRAARSHALHFISQAKGYQSQQKSVMVEDQERVEVTFQLEHSRNKG